jgi:predicted glycoside hydrolase/deacetylase ChbG (UPF0249 family)
MIVNADDLGYSASVNDAILEAFDQGLISSTTIMANMPGFEEACSLIHERRLLAHVGAHLVLSEGRPLTEHVMRCRRICDSSGSFSPSAGTVLWLSRRQREAVAAELRAQVQRCRSEGLPLTHLDSHHHVHNDPAIAPIVIELAREFGIPYVRLARNAGPGLDMARRLYKAFINQQVIRAGLARTRYFGAVDDYLYMEARGASMVELSEFEIMTHPIRNDEGRVVEGFQPFGVPMHMLVERLGLDSPPVSYAGARYQ